MPISFDSRGNITPYEAISTNILEVENVFVNQNNNSTTRKNIFDGYKEYNNDLYSQINNEFEQLINGSYTTKKLNPADIDLVNFIDSEIFLKNKKYLDNFLTKYGSKKKYLVDGYILPLVEQTDPRYPQIKAMIEYWEKQWGNDRDGNKKGFLKIKINGKI